MKRIPWLVASAASAVVALGPGTASAGTEYRTVFKRALLSGNNVVKGRIDSSIAGCVPGRKVVVHVRFDDRDKKKLGSDQTGGKGNFKIRVGRRFPLGDYLIKAKQAEIGTPGRRVTCLRRIDRSLGVSAPSPARGRVAKP
jgi:hypothetical protein